MFDLTLKCFCRISYPRLLLYLSTEQCNVTTCKCILFITGTIPEGKPASSLRSQKPDQTTAVLKNMYKLIEENIRTCC